VANQITDPNMIGKGAEAVAGVTHVITSLAHILARWTPSARRDVAAGSFGAGCAGPAPDARTAPASCNRSRRLRDRHGRESRRSRSSGRTSMCVGRTTATRGSALRRRTGTANSGTVSSGSQLTSSPTSSSTAPCRPVSRSTTRAIPRAASYGRAAVTGSAATAATWRRRPVGI